MTDLLVEAGAAFDRGEWAKARSAFLQAREAGIALAPDDLRRLGEAAWWLGLVDESREEDERRYQACLEDGDLPGASMAALDVAVAYLLRGQEERGSGWVGRSERLLADLPEGREHGYVLYLDVEGSFDGPDHEATIERARRVAEIGRTHADPNLVAMATVAEGRLLIKMGRPRDGLALLDEGMLAALSDELQPMWTGNIYCHLMTACHELGDLRRAASWTQAVADWCDRMSAAVFFTGICRVHRAHVFQVQGAWDTSEAEARRACDDLIHMHLAVVAEGSYQVGEIRRLRGDISEAERAYERAHELGRDPQPGLALLRLVQGGTESAAMSVKVVLSATTDRLERARLLHAQVDIAAACEDAATAAAAAEELDEIASTFRSSGLEAFALQQRGVARLVAGRTEDALVPLREASTRWQELGAPYDGARTRVWLAKAYRALGDHDAAALELRAAAATFEQLGAAADAREVAALRTGGSLLPKGLTEREAEVLALVAEGRTNREVAAELVLSEKTIARHLSNVFTKLGVTTRTAAAAFAFEHGIASPATG